VVRKQVGKTFWERVYCERASFSIHVFRFKNITASTCFVAVAAVPADSDSFVVDTALDSMHSNYLVDDVFEMFDLLLVGLELVGIVCLFAIVPNDFVVAAAVPVCFGTSVADIDFVLHYSKGIVGDEPERAAPLPADLLLARLELVGTSSNDFVVAVAMPVCFGTSVADIDFVLRHSKEVVDGTVVRFPVVVQ